MSILIGDYEFEGPFYTASDLSDEPGLCAMLCQVKGEFELVDLTDLDNLKHCFEGDEYTTNMRFFQDTCNGVLAAAVLYTRGMSTRQRQEIRRQLVEELDEACA